MGKGVYQFFKTVGKIPLLYYQCVANQNHEIITRKELFKVKRKNKSRLEFRFWWYTVMSLANLLFLVICEVFIVMGYQIDTALERFTNLLAKYNEQNEAGDKG